MPRTVDLIYRHDKTKLVHATYNGGPYIELGFDGRPAAEIINVYDYEKGEPTIRARAKDVVDTVRAWCNNQDEEWPEWYEGYLENS